MEMQLSVCSVCIRPASFRFQFIFKKTSILSVSCVLSSCVKYLHRVDVDIDCGTLNPGTGNLLQLLKGKFLSHEKRTGRKK